MQGLVKVAEGISPARGLDLNRGDRAEHAVAENVYAGTAMAHRPIPAHGPHLG